MTMKSAFTTEAVVCRPSDSALPWTCNPSRQAIMPITSAMNGAVMRPTRNVVLSTAVRRYGM